MIMSFGGWLFLCVMSFCLGYKFKEWVHSSDLHVNPLRKKKRKMKNE